MRDLSSLRLGMDVFDASGNKVGTVKSLWSGGSPATAAGGQAPGQEPLLLEAVAAPLNGHADLPEERRERLLRLGYVEVDGTGFGDSFVESFDAVSRVFGNTVYLSHTRHLNHIPGESGPIADRGSQGS